MNTTTNEATTDTERLALIGSRVQAARQRFTAKAIRDLQIGDMVAANGGTVTRVNNRTIRYSVDGFTVKTFRRTWANATDAMLVYLGLETEAEHRERDARIAEALEEVA